MIANGDNMSATSKVGFNPVVDKAIKTKTGFKLAMKDSVINAIKGSTESERSEEFKRLARVPRRHVSVKW